MQVADAADVVVVAARAGRVEVDGRPPTRQRPAVAEHGASTSATVPGTRQIVTNSKSQLMGCRTHSLCFSPLCGSSAEVAQALGQWVRDPADMRQLPSLVRSEGAVLELQCTCASGSSPRPCPPASLLAGCSTAIAADEEPAALSATKQAANAIHDVAVHTSASPSGNRRPPPKRRGHRRPTGAWRRSRRSPGTSARIGGDLDGHGIVFAQNMMYSHTVTVYDADGSLVATIPDSVDLAAFGVPVIRASRRVRRSRRPSPRRPLRYVVELLDVRPRLRPEGVDECTPASGYDDSFVYRIDTQTFQIDQVIAVGAVPKYVAVTPDDRSPRHQLVHLRPEHRRHGVGQGGAPHPDRAAPRGIARHARPRPRYVAVMGATGSAGST